jgi:hypothetical protein
MTQQTEFFLELFHEKKLDESLAFFESLGAEEKKTIFSALFQQSQYHQIPHSVSVLFRELHEGKSFADFHEAWFPAKEDLDPIEEGGETYQQFFPVPVRVLNAVNTNNPKEIVSIGLHWLTDDEIPQMLEVTNGLKNKKRGGLIKNVAEKTKAEVYLVKEDDNLGTK